MHFSMSVEAILNDRPLTRNPDGLEDAPALTPNMLLTFKRRSVYTPGIFDAKDVYSSRWWRRAQHLSDVFWKRWIKEYVPLLHTRQKWTHIQPDVCVDDIVLLEEENAPRGESPIARVLELQPGSCSFDGKISGNSLKCDSVGMPSSDYYCHMCTRRYQKVTRWVRSNWIVAVMSL